MSENPAIDKILEHYKPVWGLGHVSALLEWDMETYMPLGASKPRGFAQAQTALIMQEHMTGMNGMVTEAEKLPSLNDFEKGILRTIRRDLDYFLKVPLSYSKICTEPRPRQQLFGERRGKNPTFLCSADIWRKLLR